MGTLDAKDIRRNMPRFQPAAFDANLSLLPAFAALADEADCTPAQLALAWLLAQDDRLVPIPGTTRAEHLAENVGAATVRLDAAMLARVDAAIDRHAVTGSRYNATTQAEIDSEEYPA